MSIKVSQIKQSIFVGRLVLGDFDLGEDEIQSNSERERSRDMLS